MWHATDVVSVGFVGLNWIGFGLGEFVTVDVTICFFVWFEKKLVGWFAALSSSLLQFDSVLGHGFDLHRCCCADVPGVGRAQPARK